MANLLLPYEPGFPDMEQNLGIAVAGGEPLRAHYDVLKLYSSCVAGLPADADGAYTWDLGKLVLEGDEEPVAREVVERWLGIVYSHLRSADKWPRRLDGDTHALLLFADAVGSRRLLLIEIDQRLANPSFNATLFMAVDHPIKELELLGRTYYCGGAAGGVAGNVHSLPSGLTTVVADLAAMKPIIAATVEKYLYLASRLDLALVARALLRFVQSQAAMTNSASLLGDGGMATIFSTRVVDHLPRNLLLQGFLENYLLGGGKDTALAAAESVKAPAGAAQRNSSCSRMVENVLHNIG